MSNWGGARKGAGRKPGKRNLKRTGGSKNINKNITFNEFCSKEQIYIIKSLDVIKIGYTTNLIKRMKSYDTHSPHYKLLYFTNIPDALDVEVFLHKKFKNKKVKGEWFRLNDEDLLVCILYIEKIKQLRLYNKKNEILSLLGKNKLLSLFPDEKE